MADQLQTADEFFGAQAQADTAQKPAASFDALMDQYKPSYAGGVVPLSGAAWDEYFSQAPIVHVLDAFGQGVKDGWGAGPIGLSPDAEKWLRDNGQFNDYEHDRVNMFRSFNEATFRPVAAGVNAAWRGFNALYSGVSQAALAAGVPRDIVALPEAFMGSLHPMGIPRPITAARDLKVIGEGEAGWKGTADQRATVDATAKRFATPQELPPEPDVSGAPSTAKLEVEPQPGAPVRVEPPPDIHAVARQIDPDTFREFDALAQRKDTFGRWIDELAETRDKNATADTDRQIAEQKAKLEDATGKRAATYQDRIDDLTSQRDAALEKARSADSPDMARIRRELQQADYRMRDLAPQVTAAYRQARETMPAGLELPPADGMTLPAESPQIKAAAQAGAANVIEGVDDSIKMPAVTGETVLPAEPVKEPVAEPVKEPANQNVASDIAGDVFKKLVAAGRPTEEANAAAAIVATHYDARAARLGTTAQDLYAKEGPVIEAGERGRKGEAGRTVINNGRTTIRLMGNADASTFMHETGHNWLDELDRDAKDDRATPEVKQDAAAVRKWLGAEEDKAPPPATGMIRYYHGTRYEDASGFEGKTFVTPQEEYARNYRGGPNNVLYFDISKDEAIKRGLYDDLNNYPITGSIDDGAARLKPLSSATEFTRGQHEKFARGFERYLMEGRAPSRALEGVFAKFKDWLTTIYQTVTRLRAPITDDIRDVFDRLVTREPERATIAPERPAESIVDRHNRLVDETPAEKATPVADQVRVEADDHLDTNAPKVIDELGGRGGSEAGGNETADSEPHGYRPSGQSDAGGEGGSAGRGAVGQGGSEAAVEGAGIRQDTAVAERPKLKPTEPPAGPHDTIPAAESALIDKAGNIRLDNLNTPEDVSQVIRDAAAANDEFASARRNVISDAQVLDLADALGMDAAELNRRKLGQAFNAEQIVAARKLLIQSATSVRDAATRAAEGTEADVMAFAEAQTKHRMIQEQVAGITAEAGRALRAFREIEGGKEARAIGEMVHDATGMTLFQLRRQAKAMSGLDTAAQVSRQALANAKPGFWDMFLEYFVNNLISGPATHVTYSVGNTILALTKAIPETGIQAAIGAFREHALGDTGPRVYFGEISAQLKAMNQTGNPIITAAKLAKIVRDAPDAATARADAYALLRGSRDGIMAAARAAIDGTTAPLPGEGTVKGMSEMVAPRNAIPNPTIGGVTVPLGTAVRLPSRGVAIIHSYFRAVGYEQNLARLAYRQATEEALTGNAFSARVADLRQNPTEALMRAAVGESTEQTLMGRGGQVTRALSMLSNTRPFGVPLPKLINPFVHIVGNVLEQGLEERTPFALADPDIRANLLGRNGPIARDTQISRVLFGTSVGLAGFGLAMEGLQNGSGPADPKQAALYRRVNGPANSTRIGDMWYDFHRLGVVALPFTLGANIYETAHLMGEQDFGHAIGQVAFAVSKTILDESGMRGPSEFIRAIHEPDGYGARYVRSQLSSMLIPYSVGMAQEARAIDPYVRRVTDMTEAFKAKVPWWSETLFPLRDWRGEPIPSREALGIDGLSAIYEERARNDPAEQAMLRLGVYPALPEKKIRGVELTEQQYDDVSRIGGRMAGMRIDGIVRNPGFAAYPEAIQHDMIAEALKSSREAASSLVMMQSLGKQNDIVTKSTNAKLERLQRPAAKP